MISPFLIMILLMMIDCGRAAYAYATLANAARDGARAAITTGNNRPDDGWVVGAVQQNAYGVRLNPGTCMNDAPPATPSMSPNTGLVYVGAYVLVAIVTAFFLLKYGTGAREGRLAVAST